MKIFSSTEFNFLIDLIRRAGQRALSKQRSVIQVSRKPDSTIVTDSDREIQDMLISEISANMHGLNFIHEENFDTAHTEIAEETISAIIDPIDGTAAYSMYLPTWCVSIGIFKGYEPIYGFVYSPGCDMLFHSDNNNSYLNGVILKSDRNMSIDSETNIFTAAEIHRVFRINFSGKLRNLGTTALHACLTADNLRNRTLAFIGKSYLWDWAAAIAILKKAGSDIGYIDGSNIDLKETVNSGYAFRDYLIAHNASNFGIFKDIFIRINP